MQVFDALSALLATAGFHEHLDGPDDFPIGIADGRDTHADGHAMALLMVEIEFALVRQAGFDGGDEWTFTGAELSAGLVDVIKDVVLAVMANDFVGGISGDAISGLVPVRDATWVSTK